MISLSPLPTAHPRSFQPSPVRASSSCYRALTLAMGRSSRFGSTPSDSTPISDSLSLRLHLSRLNLAAESKSQTHYAKGTRSDIRRRTDGNVLPLLVSTRFQVLFHSPHWGAFHLSLTVLVHYRSRVSIQPWKMVLPASHGIPRVPRYSGTASKETDAFRVRDSHPLWSSFPGSFHYTSIL